MKKNARHRWKRRWIVLDDEYVYFCKDKDHLEPKAAVPLLTCFVKSLEQKEGENDRYCFQLLAKDETYKFYTETEEELNDWVNTIKNACDEIMKLTLGQTSKDSFGSDVSTLI